MLNPCCAKLHLLPRAGYNDDGQLGNGGYKPSTTPVKVVGSHRFILLGESMGMHTCGIAATEAGSGQPAMRSPPH